MPYNQEPSLRVLLLTTSFPLTSDASSGVFVERLAQRLAQRCQLHVLAPAGREPVSMMHGIKYRLSTYRYAPARWQLLAHGGGGIPAALAARPWLNVLVPLFIASMAIHCLWHARRADIIFANWSICGVIAGVVGRLLGRPVVTTIRGEDANRAASSFIHRWMIMLCLRLGGRVVTVSDDLVLCIKALFPSLVERVVMIPNGVDVMMEGEGSHEQSGDTAIRLLMIGSLIPRKSVATALSALAKLPEQYSLTVLGDGVEREALQKMVTHLDLGERVNFIGHVPPAEVSHWLAKADVLVMTSRSEGRPNAVLEAMAAGLPVVGSDIPGVRELVIPEVSGALFPVGHVDALVNCLLPLADESLRRRLGAGARRFINEQGLTWENSAALYLRQFEQLLIERSV